MCQHHICDDPTALQCDRTDEHAPGHGCTYDSGTGVAHCPKEEL